MSKEFKINQNGINPKDVPLKLLNSGYKMPFDRHRYIWPRFVFCRADI